MEVFPFAQGLALKAGLDIHIVHFYQVDLGEFHGATHFQYTDIEKNLKEEMEAFLEKLPKNPKVKLNHSLEIGFPIQGIKRLSSEDKGKYKFIVMSTQGQRNAVERFFGSIAAEVSVRADIPVLLVPAGLEYKPVENIVFAANRESVHKESIDKIRALVKVYGASVHFVYVTDGKEKGDKETVREKIINALFDSDVPDFPFLIHFVEDDQVMDGINHYIKKTDADLAVFCNINRNFWRSVLHRSITKKMAMNTSVPLLVIHLKEER